jgi:hypothetical protein
MSALTLVLVSCSSPEFSEPKMPAELTTPGVTKGEAEFGKSLFFDRVRLGFVTDIRYRRFGGRADPLLAIVGSWGAVFTDATGHPIKVVRFRSGRPDFVRLVDMGKDGVPWFLARGQLYVSLLDEMGNRRWTYTSYWGINDAAVADINGDGISEIVVGLNGFGGVRLLDSQGHKVWGLYRDGNIWDVALLPGPNGGVGRIYYTESGGELKICNPEGEELIHCRPDAEYISDFELTRWGGESAPRHFVAPRDGSIIVFDQDGILTAKLNAPESVYLGDARATPVRFKDSSIFFATLILYRLWGRSVLYMHDARGNLVYKEIFGGPCLALEALPIGGTERLLLSGGDKVWQYAPVAAATGSKGK